MAERHLLFWDWAVRNYLPYVSPTAPCVDVIKTNDLKTQLPSLRLLKCLSVHGIGIASRFWRVVVVVVVAVIVVALVGSGGSGSRSLFDRPPPTISLCHTRGLALVFFFFFPPSPAVLSRARHHGFHFVNWHRRTFRSFVFALMFRPWCFEGGAHAVARFHYERYTRAGNTAIAMSVEKRPT